MLQLAWLTSELGLSQKLRSTAASQSQCQWWSSKMVTDLIVAAQREEVAGIYAHFPFLFAWLELSWTPGLLGVKIDSCSPASGLPNILASAAVAQLLADRDAFHQISSPPFLALCGFCTEVRPGKYFTNSTCVLPLAATDQKNRGDESRPPSDF